MLFSIFRFCMVVYLKTFLVLRNIPFIFWMDTCIALNWLPSPTINNLSSSIGSYKVQRFYLANLSIAVEMGNGEGNSFGVQFLSHNFFLGTPASVDFFSKKAKLIVLPKMYYPTCVGHCRQNVAKIFFPCTEIVSHWKPPHCHLMLKPEQSHVLFT